MTCLEKLAMEHPEKVNPNLNGGASGCPSSYGYMDDPPEEICGGEENCRACWNRECPGTLPSVYPIDVQATAELAKDTEAPWPKENPHIPGENKTEPTIKDSGDRTQFETGAVRDMREGKGRCDLMPLEVVSRMFTDVPHCQDPIIQSIGYFQDTLNTEYLYGVLVEFCTKQYHAIVSTMLLEVAKHFEEGAKKYGENNWQKGIPVHCYIDSAVRHYLKWLRGDKDEPHDRAFVWNLMCCIWEVDYREKENKNV